MEHPVRKTGVVEADAGEICALDPSKMKVGDIVLLSGRGVASWAIRMGTASDFSHAALLTQPGMLLEAQPEGVRRRSPWGTYAIRREWICVLRPTFSVDTNERGLSLSQCAETRYGWAYSKVRAIGSPWPTAANSAGWLDGTFCSELVARAFADYGVDLLPEVKCAEITPGKLTESKLLSNVTGECVRVLHPVRDANEFTLATKVHDRGEPREDMEVERQCLEAIRASQALPPTIRSLHDAFAWLAQLDLSVKDNTKIDARFLQVLDREGYFEFYESVAREIGFGARPFLEALAAAQNLDSTSLTKEISMLLSDLEKMLPTFEQSFNARVLSYERSLDLQNSGSKTLSRLRQVQEQMLVQSLRLRQARNGLVKALRAAKSR